MEVIPNLPLALALAVPFLVTLFALWAILFKPLLGYRTEREHAVVHARHETDKLTHEITGRVSALETKLASAREEVTALRDAARARAVEQQNAIIAAGSVSWYRFSHGVACRLIALALVTFVLFPVDMATAHNCKCRANGHNYNQGQILCILGKLAR